MERKIEKDEKMKGRKSERVKRRVRVNERGVEGERELG